jgi:hypothetical protein
MAYGEHQTFIMSSTSTYLGNCTNIGTQILSITSDSDNPTSISFSESFSGTALLVISTGKLNVDNVIFLYDSTTAAPFVSVVGTGLVKMLIIVVKKVQTTTSQSTNSFIWLSEGGTVEISESSLEDFSSSVGVISLGYGDNVLLLDFVTTSNINFTGSGSLVYSNGGSQWSGGMVNISNSNFTAVKSSGGNGSIIHIDGDVGSLYISNISVSTDISASNGGGFWICNCAGISIQNSNFSNGTASGGKGGMIYFGENTVFTLDSCVFLSSSAQYGGAIFSGSDISSLRMINNVTFGDNIGSTGGSDIADNSMSGYLLYSAASVTSSTSNSTGSSRFCIIKSPVDYIFDCLLSTEENACTRDTFYVDSSNGGDYAFCGSSTSQCASITQSIQNLLNNGGNSGTVYVLSGIYTNTSVTVSNLNMTIQSVSGSTTKPTISLLSPGYGVTMMVNVMGNGNLIWSGTEVKYNIISGSNITLFSTGSISAVLNLSDSDFSVNGTEGVVPQSFIRHNGGTIVINGCTFTGVSLNLFSLIRFAGGSGGFDPLVLNISDTLFNGIESQGDFGAVISTPTPRPYKLALTNVNITNSNSTSALNKKGVVYLSTSNGAIILLTYVIFDGIKLNSTGGCGAFSLSGIAQLLSIDGCTFNNTRTGQYGGGAFINVSNFGSSESSVIQNTTFSGCAATYGGGIYIGSLGIKLFLCKFDKNDGTTGIDIYEDKDVATSFYSSSNLELCCSDSIGMGLFSLNDGNNWDIYLPSCSTPQRYVSNSGNDNSDNTCRISTNPCRSISRALIVGTSGDFTVVYVSVVGDYDVLETATVVPGIELYIQTVNTSTTQSGIKFGSSVTTNINLFTTTTGQIEAKNVKLQIGGSSEGSFFLLSGAGVVNILESTIVSDGQGASQNSLASVTGNGEVYLISVSVTGLTFTPSTPSTLPLINMIGSSSVSIISSNFSSISSNSTSGVIFSDAGSSSSRIIRVFVNNSIFSQINNYVTTQGIVGTFLGGVTSNITVHNCTFGLPQAGITGNSSLSILGGCIYIGSANLFECDECLLQFINGISVGGGLYLNRSISVIIQNSNFSTIQVSDRAGIYLLLFINLFF